MQLDAHIIFLGFVYGLEIHGKFNMVSGHSRKHTHTHTFRMDRGPCLLILECCIVGKFDLHFCQLGPW